MKISQLVATKKYTQYYESVANKLPRGIKTQQQLLNLGYRVAVEDLGLAKAKTLNENFAAKLVNSYHKQCIDEGIGSFLGKAAGNVVGAVNAAGRGIKNAWNDAKAGYAAGKGSWDDNAAAASAAGGTAAAPAGGGAAPAAGGTAAPAAGGAAAPAGGGAASAAGGTAAAPAGGGAAPAGGERQPALTGGPTAGLPPAAKPLQGADRPYVAPAGGGIGDIMKAIDGLDPASKKQLAGELEKSINTPAPAEEEPATNPDELDAIKKNAGLPAAAPEAPAAAPEAPAAAPEAPAAQGAGAFGQMAAQLGGQKPNTMANAPVSKTNVAKPGNSNAAAPAAPAPAVDPKAQQANLKARLKTGQGMGTKTGTGFKQSRVGVPVQKLVGKNPDGSPKFSTVREDVEFHSNFLGMKI